MNKGESEQRNISPERQREGGGEGPQNGNNPMEDQNADGQENGRQMAPNGERESAAQGIWASLINRQMLLSLVPIQLPEGIVHQFIGQYNGGTNAINTNGQANADAVANNVNASSNVAANNPPILQQNDPEMGIQTAQQHFAASIVEVNECENKEGHQNIRIFSDIGSERDNNATRNIPPRNTANSGRNGQIAQREGGEGDDCECGIFEYFRTFNAIAMLGMFLCFLAVCGYALVKFIVEHFQIVPFLCVLFAATTLIDTFAFKKSISSNGWAWPILIRIILRQFLILYVLQKYNIVFSALIFALNHDPTSFWSNIFIIILSNVFIKDCTLALKVWVFYIPSKFLQTRKGMLYQWLEYSSQMYKFAVPFVPWNAYVNIHWFSFVYVLIKTWTLNLLFAFWLIAFCKIFSGPPKIGKQPTELECSEQQNECSICRSTLREPIKLKCSHIFCTECIQTWLERKMTCPFCRAMIPEADEHKKYRDGDGLEVIYW